MTDTPIRRLPGPLHLGLTSIGSATTQYREGSSMKVRKSLRSLKQKPGAQVIRRHGKVFVINKKNPRYKARQG